MITTAYQIKQMSIERQEEPKNSFMGVSMEPSVNKKKFHSHVMFVCMDSLNLAGTWVTHPVLVTWLFGWKHVLSPVANVPACSRSTRFSLQGSFEEGDCLGIDILSFELPSANGGCLAVLSLAVCTSLGLCTETTVPASGEELLDGGVFSL